MKSILALLSLVKASSSESEPTTETLISNLNTRLIYTYRTLVEDDEFFLLGELSLKGLNTFNFVDSDTPENYKSVRMSVGWRNPMEDAYDVTSFNMEYDKDESKIKFTAEDGYAWGSIDSFYYGFKSVKKETTSDN
jgi:hypothetical protein